MPSGTHGFADHLDGLGENPVWIEIHLAVRFEGGEAIVDFTSAAPELKGDKSWNIVNPGAGERVLTVTTAKPETLDHGDVFRHLMAGGGDFGPSREREPARVLEDVRAGRVSPEQARETRVVLVVEAKSGLAIDQPATARRRRALTQGRW